MTPAPACLARPLVRLLTVLLTLAAVLAPASAVAASPATDDSVEHELVLSVRSVVAPAPSPDDDDLLGTDTPIGTASTDDGLVHPDLEPHDGPPPLRGPPAN